MKKTLFLFCALIFNWASFSEGAFEERYWGARVSGLGGAYGIISDDAAGVFYNVAKLGSSQGKQLEFGYGQLFTGVSGVSLSVSNFGYAHPLKTGVLGIGWGSFGAKDLYREDVIVLGYGLDLRKLFNGLDREIDLGISTRVLMRRFILDQRTVGDPVFKDGRVNSNMAIDLHFYTALNEVMPGFGAGLSLKSLNKPTIGFVEKEQLLPEIVASVGWKGKKWTVPFDLSHQETLTPHFGLERKMMDERVILRAGSDLSQVGSGFGYRHKLQTVEISLDYSFIWPIHFQKGSGSHRTSLGLKF